MRIVMIGAALVALGACGQTPANNQTNQSGNTANAAAPANKAVDTSANRKALDRSANADDPVRRGIASRWPGGQPVTPGEVREMIRTMGASETLTALVSAQANNRFDTVLRGIALGEREWLQVADLLTGSLDGEAAELFYAALSETLVTSPSDALRLMGGPDAAEYCSDQGAITDPAQRSAWYSAALSAVESVSDPDLQATKSACLQTLRTESAG